MANIDLYMQKLTNIANAIRNKLGERNTYTLEEMPGKIESIPTGSSSVILSKMITSNGTYNASSDNADGYNPVMVNVPGPSGTKLITIRQNGNYQEDVTNYARASIFVDVPQPLPVLVSKNISANGTYKASDEGADGYDEVTVNVSSSSTCGLVLQGFEVVTPTPTEVS